MLRGGICYQAVANAMVNGWRLKSTLAPSTVLDAWRRPVCCPECLGRRGRAGNLAKERTGCGRAEERLAERLRRERAEALHAALENMAGLEQWLMGWLRAKFDVDDQSAMA